VVCWVEKREGGFEGGGETYRWNVPFSVEELKEGRAWLFGGRFLGVRDCEAIVLVMGERWEEIERLGPYGIILSKGGRIGE